MEIDVLSIVPDGWDPADGLSDPAHAIIAFSSFSWNRRGVHGRDPCRREDGRRPEASPVHLCGQIVGHIFGTRDQEACRNVGNIVEIKWGKHPKEPAMALCQPVTLG